MENKFLQSRNLFRPTKTRLYAEIRSTDGCFFFPIEEYVRGLMQKFDWQLHLRTIDEELEEMFQMINKDLRYLDDIEFTHTVSDVWDMVRKSNVVGDGQTSLEDKNNFELFTIFLNMIEHVMEVNPRKQLI